MLNWVDHVEGYLPTDDLWRAFVMGAKWWEWHDKGATMFNSDVRLAEAKAEEHYPGGKLPRSEQQEACQLCDVQRAMDEIMRIIDDLPEWNSSLFDDVLTDVHNAASNAKSLFSHEHAELTP